MKRVPRPKFRPRRPNPPAPFLFALPLGMAIAWPVAPRAQTPPAVMPPLASSYATRDGRSLMTILGCTSTDGTFTAQACGVAGHPLHVQVDSTASGSSAPGSASGQLTGVQGGGAGALPVAVSQSGVWTLTLPSGAHVALDGGGNVIGGVVQSGAWSVAVNNFPATQAVSAASLPLPAGAAVAVNQSVVNADGGSQVHVMNPPATQPVTGSVAVSNLPATQAVTVAALPLPAGAATAANQAAINADGGGQVHLVNALPAGTNTIGAVVEANRSAAWTDASFTATTTASIPTGLAATASRTGLHVWNLGSATLCLNYTVAAIASGGACMPGSVPVPPGSAYLEDQPGNVSPEAISLVCAGTACPLTIKVR